LARRSGVSQSLIAKIEAGLLDPSFTKLKAISDALERLDARPHLTAEGVMVRDVVAVFADQPVEQAVDHVARRGISQLPVLDDGTLVGTVTEARLLAFIAQTGGPDALRRPVRDVMTEALPQVPPETHIEGLVSLLEVFPAVLVAANGRVQGIVTKSDLLRAAKDSARPAARTPDAVPGKNAEPSEAHSNRNKAAASAFNAR
jgi:predicted transcriptional regulator